MSFFELIRTILAVIGFMAIWCVASGWLIWRSDIKHEVDAHENNAIG
jgi:hypothetical protein